GWLLQPYAKLSYQASPQLQFTAGLHAMHFFLNDRSSIEPRLSIGFRPAARHQLRLAYGLHSQLQLPGTYFSAISDSLGNLSFPNQNLDFTKAHHVVLSYRFNALQNLSIRIEPYFQRLFNVPIVDATDRTFSVLNLLEGNVSEALTNAGTGTNYGVELTVEKLLSQNYYFLISGAWYESLYTAGDGIQRDTRFNGNYMLSATAGYEWERYNKKGKQGIFGLNLRTLYRGGFRGMPIDVAASVAQNRTVFIESNGFTESFGDFFRIDLRFTFKRNKPNYTSTLGIDVQNLLNTQNIAYQAFDFVQESVITKYQFGLLPLLSYRWEF
ncbi:MAG: TonB-dependent receptor, partial [Bacteroidota bacterium]